MKTSAGVDFTDFEIILHEMGHAYNVDIDNYSDNSEENNQDDLEEQR